MTTPRSKTPLTGTGPDGQRSAPPSAEAAGPQKTSPKTTSPKTTSPKTTSPKTTGRQKAGPEATDPQKTSPQKTSPQKTSPRGTGRQEAAAQKVAPPKAAAQKVAPPKVAPQKVAPPKVAPQKVAPPKVAPPKAGPQKVAPHKIAPPKVAPPKAGPPKAGPQKVAPSATARSATGPQATAEPGPQPQENLADTAAQLAGGAEAAVGPAPFALGLRGALGALRFLGQQAIREPMTLLQDTPEAAREVVRIALGQSEVEPARGDKRFADPAWRDNPLYRMTMQAYLYFGSRVNPFVDNLGLEDVEAERLRFGLELIREAMAPTNFLLGNPAALKRMLDTGGGSVRKGLANWANDVVDNHGMPSMVDRRPFKMGENIAISPGAVIHRGEVFELIQYTPQSDTVYQRPMVIVPPQVNKYYAMDLSEGRSLYEHLLKNGIQVFGMSWRNPTEAQRDWNFDTYVQATIEAVDVAREVSGSPDANIMGACLGGMTSAIAQAHLAVLGENKIHAGTLMVTLLDTESEGRMFLFASPQTLELARKVSEATGVIDGWRMASMFAWLRPNDLVWNYWVNNYLLGQDPPAFDILAWNADTTRLPSAFHHQLLDMVAGNQLVHPDAMTVLGTPIDLSRITGDTYVAAGMTDHITTWHTCYQSTQLVSGPAEFVLCSSGHIQTVVADPKHRGLGYFLNPKTPPAADEWLAGAQRHEGSWWDHWVAWLSERSGARVPAPQAVGSDRFPPMEPAPGTYVRE